MHWSAAREVGGGRRTPHPFRIAVLGARGVGKTAIVERFLHDDYSEVAATGETLRRRRVHVCAAVLNGHVHDLRITDYPAISSFPGSSLQEWSDVCCRGIRSAHVYILVYDICCIHSFQYVQIMRQQILETRVPGSGETPILVVGNKRDLQCHRVVPRCRVSDLVRRSWRCGYVECSAKLNWQVLRLFGEALRGVACVRCKQLHATIRFQQALRRQRCALM